MLSGLHGSPATRDARRALCRRLVADPASQSSPPLSSSLSLLSASVDPALASRRATHSQPVPLDRLGLLAEHQSTVVVTSDSRLRGPHSAKRPRRSRNCKTFKRAGCSATRKQGAEASLEQQPRQQRVSDQIMDMYSQVDHLQRRRALYESVLVNARSRAYAYATDTTTSFYALFARGLDRHERPQHSRQAEAFLRTTMTDDVVCKEFVGVEPFLRQYEATTKGHASMVLELHRVRVLYDDEGCSDRIQIFAEATARLRICRATLERFFPSVIHDEALTQKLIGREYVLQYDKVFHFRLSDGRIVQHESRIDFCASLLTMVGDPFLALRLVEASLMTKHGHWKIDACIEEDRHQLENEIL